MAYGRLDVFWPDGLLKTFLLSEPSISIGRSSGNAIALDTDTISRYHLSISRKDDMVFITDLESVNGTFVDGVKLSENKPHQLYGGEEILMGELRVIYHDLDENPTRPIIVPEEATRRIELEQANFRIDVEGPEIPISPGAHTAAEVIITNTGDKSERFVVEVTGVPREWVRIDRQELEIAPRKSGDVMISFKPLRRSDSKPGDYKVQVTVRPKHDPSLALNASVVLHVLAYSGFGMALETAQLNSDDQFRLHIHNQGSDTLPLTLMTRDLANGLRFSNMSGTQIALAPGQRAVLQGQVSAKQRPLFGGERDYPFDLVVRSGDASGFLVSARGHLREKSPLPGWALYAFGGLALALVAVILVGVFVLLQPVPDPTINSFSLSSTRVAQGDPLGLNWNVANASSIVISMNGTPVATAEPDANTAQVDTASYSGNVTVGVIARSGSGEDNVSQQVVIYAPLQVSAFTVDPTPLVRYVFQSMTLRWEVPDAQTTQLVGIDTFSTTPVESTYGASGSVNVVGRLTADQTTVTLLAQDDNGQTLQQILTLTAIDPQCTAQRDISLHSGPTLENQVISTVTSGQIIVVDARNQGSDWLRVQIVGGAHGWGERSAFACANTFNPDDLQIDLNFPTPIPTSTPTTTLTPTPTQALSTTSAAPATTLRPPPIAGIRPSITPTPSPTVFVGIVVPQVTPFATASPVNVEELPKTPIADG